jgi:ATP-binding cassette subfamily B (MDR/TAP) protein 1
MASLGLALYTSWKLTLVIVSTTPVIVVIIAYLGASMQQSVRKQQEKLTEALKYVSNAINAIETVKCFNGQEHELGRYSTRLKEAAGWYYRVVNVNSQQFGFMGFFTLAMFVQGFYYGGVQVDNHEKNTGDVITTFFSAISAFQAISSILPQMIVLQKGRTAGSTLRAVMAQIARGPDALPLPELVKPSRCDGSIEFRNASQVPRVLLSLLTVFLGVLRLSSAARSNGFEKRHLLYSGTRYYVHHWKEWIRKKHVWPIAS